MRDFLHSLTLIHSKNGFCSFTAAGCCSCSFAAFGGFLDGVASTATSFCCWTPAGTGWALSPAAQASSPCAR